MVLPRRFLNEDEELLAEMHPHWIFLFGPLFTSIGVWAVILVLLIIWRNPPGWTSYPFLILALIPGLWLLGRFVRWKSYDVVITSTRLVVRQGILGRDTIQVRLQRVVEVNIRQSLIERMLQTGSLLIDAQGDDDTLTLEYMRKPAVVQRVLNSLINEILGGGRREDIPEDLRPREARRGRPGAPAVGDHPDEEGYDGGHDEGHDDTPPFGVEAPTAPLPAPAPAGRAEPSEIRDRLIELDDLRRRGILSDAEFAAKKSELLGRI
ncbi:MAG TPA: PH domain-containing protein [Acidimicrobiales bacterium]|nr:PH domain-containing protein [Acidimicrobiales bacterium]